MGYRKGEGIYFDGVCHLVTNQYVVTCGNQSFADNFRQTPTGSSEGDPCTLQV